MMNAITINENKVDAAVIAQGIPEEAARPVTEALPEGEPERAKSGPLHDASDAAQPHVAEQVEPEVQTAKKEPVAPEAGPAEQPMVGQYNTNGSPASDENQAGGTEGQQQAASELPIDPDYGMPVHPACNVFPQMAADRLAALADDIRANGLLHPSSPTKVSSSMDATGFLRAARRACSREPSIGVNTIAVPCRCATGFGA